ncbi:hypothetical protein O181_027768 [Austropuccinia psidii MF-1]|uniref:Uncharacterized protein n=1 Tax=Austropuccinia psidii MF-1 TaxID=1389203 RepID=A0A9Q3CSF2_9BASI|nr:hypothetical protein [Austropuccinia psidii MF-1]
MEEVVIQARWSVEWHLALYTFNHSLTIHSSGDLSKLKKHKLIKVVLRDISRLDQTQSLSSLNMPSPILIAAGVVIVCGAGYLIVNELMKSSNRAEEEWYQNYCKMVREEAKALKSQKADSEDSTPQDEKDKEDSADDKSDSNQLLASSSQNKLFNKNLIHRRSTRSHTDYPLIDLNNQSYPPNSNSLDSEIAWSSSTNRLCQQSLGSSNFVKHLQPQSNLIFSAPSEIENPFEDSERDNLSKHQLHQLPTELQSKPEESILELKDPDQQTLDQLTNFSDNFAQYQSLASPSSSSSSSRSSTLNLTEEGLEIITQQLIEPPLTSASHYHNQSPSIDECWSDLGTESFESISNENHYP